MDKNELLRMIQKSEKMFERRKQKRFTLIVLLYAAILLGICYLQDRLVNASLLDIIGEVVACIIISIISCLFNSVVFGQLFKLNQEEKETLEFLKKRLKDKEKE